MKYYFDINSAFILIQVSKRAVGEFVVIHKERGYATNITYPRSFLPNIFSKFLFISTFLPLR